MAAIPSAINIIENHLSSSSEFGKFQQQSIYQLIKPSTIIENDKEQLIDVELEEGGPAAAKNGKKDIRHQYTKIWPFFVLKTANWLLLLLLAIGTSLCASYHIWWSRYWVTVFRERPYSLALEFAVSQWILFGLLSVSMLAHFVIKKDKTPSPFFASLFSLMDLCISALCVPILLAINMIFSLITLAEYRWFLPKLAHYNGTQEQLTELTETMETRFDDNYHYVDYRYVAMRKRNIFLHLLADPLISFLSAGAILLNLALLVCVCRIFRRCNIWASCCVANDNISNFDQDYSKHYPYGMVKTLQWLIPAITLFSFLFIPLFNMNLFNDNFLIGLGFVSIVCFGQWLFYFCRVHLREEFQFQSNQPNRLATIAFMDLFISFQSILLFSTMYLLFGHNNVSAYEGAIYWLTVGPNILALVLVVRLIWPNPTVRTMLANLPRISVQIHFNVTVEKREEAAGEGEEAKGIKENAKIQDEQKVNEGEEKAMPEANIDV